MPFPVEAGTGTVICQLWQEDKLPATGVWTFRMDTVKIQMLTAVTPATIGRLQAGIKVTLDTGGAISKELLARDPDGNPSDWTYSASFAGSIEIEPFSFNLDVGQVLDLSSVIKVSASAGVAITRGLKGDPGADGTANVLVVADEAEVTLPQPLGTLVVVTG